MLRSQRSTILKTDSEKNGIKQDTLSVEFEDVAETSANRQR
jgi:hypothetical protein